MSNNSNDGQQPPSQVTPQDNAIEIFSAAGFAEVKAKFTEAERILKIVEQLHNQGMVVPAINELRYAGFHILKALTATEQDGQNEQLGRAAKHCKRAYYDAVEVGIEDCLATFFVFQDDYKMILIQSIVPTYKDTLAIVDDVTEFIVSTKKDERDEYYEELYEKYTVLKESVKCLDRMRPELNKSMRSDRTKATRVVIGLCIAFLGTCAAIISLWPAEPTEASSFEVCMKSYLAASPNMGPQALEFCSTPPSEEVLDTETTETTETEAESP